MAATLSTSVVIPAYNEEKRLPSTLDRVLSFEGVRCKITQIVVVDDGSSDLSATTARRAGAGDDRVHVVSYSPNAGKGYAIRRGVVEASAETILLCDADLSTPIEDLEKLAPLLDEYDIVIGSRALDVSTVAKKQPWYRQLMGKTFNRIMRTVTGLPYLDTQCGFKLMTRNAALSIFSEAVVDRFAYDVEMLMIAARLGLRVKEVPVIWINSDDSRVRIVRDSSRMLFDIVRTRMRLGRMR